MARKPPSSSPDRVGQLKADEIRNYALFYGIPPQIALAMWNQESGGGRELLSPKGARGAFQLMPDTFQEVIPGGDIDDPEQNVRAGMIYLARQKKRWGTWDRALQAYNAGSPADYVNKKGVQTGERTNLGPGSTTQVQYAQQILARAQKRAEKEGDTEYLASIGQSSPTQVASAGTTTGMGTGTPAYTPPPMVPTNFSPMGVPTDFTDTLLTQLNQPPAQRPNPMLLPQMPQGSSSTPGMLASLYGGDRMQVPGFTPSMTQIADEAAPYPSMLARPMMPQQQPTQVALAAPGIPTSRQPNNPQMLPQMPPDGDPYDPLLLIQMANGQRPPPDMLAMQMPQGPQPPQQLAMQIPQQQGGLDPLALVQMAMNPPSPAMSPGIPGPSDQVERMMAQLGLSPGGMNQQPLPMLPGGQPLPDLTQLAQLRPQYSPYTPTLAQLGSEASVPSMQEITNTPYRQGTPRAEHPMLAMLAKMYGATDPESGLPMDVSLGLREPGAPSDDGTQQLRDLVTTTLRGMDFG